MQAQECAVSHCRNDSVPKGSEAVHPRGNPISHSTHVGFNAPPGVSVHRLSTAGIRLGVLLFPKRTASVKLTPAWAFDPARVRLPELLLSPAVGVGQIAGLDVS